MDPREWGIAIDNWDHSLISAAASAANASTLVSRHHMMLTGHPTFNEFDVPNTGNPARLLSSRFRFGYLRTFLLSGRTENRYANLRYTRELVQGSSVIETKDWDHLNRGVAMAFGGYYSTSSVANDVNEWNGTSWDVIPTTGRPPRQFLRSPDRMTRYLSAAYDARRDKFVLFGSGEYVYGESRYMNLTPSIWEWDATQGWVTRTVTFPGTFASGVKMHFNAQRGTLIAFVLNTPSPPSERVFEWDGGNTWQELVPVSQPPAGYYWASFDDGYDPLRGHLSILRHNVNNMWISVAFDNFLPATFSSHGAGCPGSLGTTQLALRHPWTRAWLGRSLEVELSNLPQSAGFIAVGWSDQQYAGITLPVPLDILGMPGCHARVSLDSVHFVAGSSGRAGFVLPIPVLTNFIGNRFFQQSYSIDPGANALGMTLSNSVRIHDRPPVMRAGPYAAPNAYAAGLPRSDRVKLTMTVSTVSGIT
jgi:hypothetical protein